MNKNTTILLGAIAVLAIGVWAYVSMSSPSDKEFTIQSFRKSVQTQPTTIAPDWSIYWWDDDGDTASKPIIDYNSLGYCTVTFDDGYVYKWAPSENGGGTCCKITHPTGQSVCYNWREPWVTGVEYGDQPVKEEAILDGNLD